MSTLPNGNATELSAGTGIFLVDQLLGSGPQDVGYTSGSIIYKGYKKPLDFKCGIPRRLVKRTTIEVGATFELTLAQFSVANLAMGMGGNPVTTTSATLQTESNQAFTIGNYPYDPTFLGFLLNGPNITMSGGGGAPVVKQAGTTLTYGTAYTVDPVLGGIIFLPGGGSFTYGESDITVSYSYTPLATSRVYLGSQFGFNTVAITYNHYRPDNGKYMRFYLPYASVDGNFQVSTNPTDWNEQKITFECLAIAGETDQDTFGYIEEQM